MTRMRIVHCFRSPVGGVFRHVRDLVDAQFAAGHQIGIVCDSSTGGALEAQRLEEIRPMLALGICRLPMQRHVGPSDLTAAWPIYRAIARMQPQVLHGHGAKGGVYARLIGSCLQWRAPPVARIYSPHGGALHYDSKTLAGRFFFALERMMMRMTDQLLFVSEYELASFRTKIGQPRAPFRLVYNGLRASEFTPVPAAADAADFLYIGMMRDLKGPDLFIEAIALTRQRLGRPVSAVMVGEGGDRPRYEAMARRLGLGEAIRFIKPMAARAAFSLGHVVVVPSRAEALPYIVLEALAAGKPVIASAVGGIPEIFGQGSRCLTRPTSSELAGRMWACLQDRHSFQLAAPAMNALKARFGVDTMSRQVGEAYLAAIARQATISEQATIS